MSQIPRIDVHGMTSPEAKRYVAIYLKEFRDIGYPEVLIVHGKGKGVLRKTIRKLLENTPYVTKVRVGSIEEGGDGVTVAII